jgi:hypothetical protein
MSERGLDLDDAEAAGAVAAAIDTSRAVRSDAARPRRRRACLAGRGACPVRAALLPSSAVRGQAGGAVLDGRDIGTAVCPEADVKIYVTASAEERARRRTAELVAKGRDVDYETILAEIRARDARDSGRAAAPLRLRRQGATVVAIEKDLAVIDVGLKTEGRVPLKEFAGPGRDTATQGRRRGRGLSRARRERARRGRAVARQGAPRGELGQARGEASRRTRRSPASSSTRSRAASPSISTAPWPSCRAAGRHPPGPRRHPADAQRRSRSRSSRWIAAAATSSCRAAPCSKRPAPSSARSWCRSLEEGQVIDGVVKNITDYGAFVDLGGIDGLLHVTDIAWRRVNHPTEVLNIGQTVKVQIIRSTTRPTASRSA